MQDLRWMRYALPKTRSETKQTKESRFETMEIPKVKRRDPGKKKKKKVERFSGVGLLSIMLNIEKKKKRRPR
jgi:hypothetical protein